MPIRKLNPIQLPLDLHSSGEMPDLVKKFVTHMEQVVIDFNSAIYAYNNANDRDEKLKQLKALYENLQVVNNGCSDEVVSACSAYQGTTMSTKKIFYHEEFNKKLFQDIQNEFKSLGIVFTQAAALRGSPESTEDPSFLVDIIANMAPDKLEQFAQLLEEKKRDSLSSALRELYKDDELGADNFKHFLENHTISVISRGNSKNFEIKNKNSQKKEVLQLENRFSLTKNAEIHLRKYALSSILLPVLADRKTSFFLRNDFDVPCTRNVLVKPFCKDKDLESDTNLTASPDSPQVRQQKAIDIYTQMAEVLGVVEANGCVFTDMKNSNWLIDASRNLRIADTKSFLFANRFAQLDLDDAEETNGNGGNCVNTPYMNSPEMLESGPFPADKLHAYMLGRNLYQYLTQCDKKYLCADDSTPMMQKPKSLDDLSFLDAIFTGSPGENLKVLIQNLMAEDPTKRPSVAEARERLKGMGKAPSVRESARLFECRDYPRKQIVDCMQEIEKFRVTARGVRDVGMDDFFTLIDSRMKAAQTCKEMLVVEGDVESVLESLKKSKSMVQDIEERMNQQGYDMQAKGIRVGKALAKVPLDQRGDIAKGESDETEAVLKAMAARRYHWVFVDEKEKEGTLDPNKNQANMFKDFKKRYQKSGPKEATPEEGPDANSKKGGSETPAP